MRRAMELAALVAVMLLACCMDAITNWMFP